MYILKNTMAIKCSSASIALERLTLCAKSEIDIFKKVLVNFRIFFLCNAFTTCLTKPLFLSLQISNKSQLVLFYDFYDKK